MTDTSPEGSIADTSQPTKPSDQPSDQQDVANAKTEQQHTNPAQQQPKQVFSVDATRGKRIAIVSTFMLVVMQLLVTLVILVSQPAGAPDARAWLFVISSWLLASVVLAAVWQIAVFAQQASLHFEETGVLVSRPGMLGVSTRRVLLPYDQLHTARFDLSDYPAALEATLMTDQRSIVFDALRLRQHRKRLPITTTAHLPTHPLVLALKDKEILLEVRQTSQVNWDVLDA